MRKAEHKTKRQRPKFRGRFITFLTVWRATCVRYQHVQIDGNFSCHILFPLTIFFQLSHPDWQQYSRRSLFVCFPPLTRSFMLFFLSLSLTAFRRRALIPSESSSRGKTFIHKLSVFSRSHTVFSLHPSSLSCIEKKGLIFFSSEKYSSEFIISIFTLRWDSLNICRPVKQGDYREYIMWEVLMEFSIWEVAVWKKKKKWKWKLEGEKLSRKILSLELCELWSIWSDTRLASGLGQLFSVYSNSNWI